MGFSMSWVAVAGKSKAEVLATLSLVDTGETDYANECPLSGTALPGGWYLLYVNEIVNPYNRAPALRKLSAGGRALVVQVEEHIMSSSVFMYEDGVKTWDVTHESHHDVYHLAVEGTPPPALEGIRADMAAKQDAEGGNEADVDYLFDVPAILAATICGYRHDEVALASGEEVEYTRLVAANA